MDIRKGRADPQGRMRRTTGDVAEKRARQLLKETQDAVRAVQRHFGDWMQSMPKEQRQKPHS